jgi:tRNA(Arg) A34 adenosine deaminase TadA
MFTPQELMRLAIDKAREGVAAGQSPFGCAIARGDELLAVAHNSVWAATDITAHAEICALRIACGAARAIHLVGATVATTCEPCPMCLAALHWARVETVYFGATIADAAAAGFNELPISASEMIRRGGDCLQLVPGILADECRELFQHWLQTPRHRAY